MARTSDKTGFLFKLDLIICTIAFVLTLPLALILCIPMAIYRKLVQISAKINQPDLARIAPPIQQALFHNDFDKDRVYNIITWNVLEGALKLENLLKIIQEKLINQVGSNGDLEFPEFQQYFSLYGGYAFFKWDRTFDASNHVRYLDEAQDGSVATENDLQKIIARLMTKGWPKNKSSWEIIVVNNYRTDSTDTNTNKSVLIFRFHHSLADGYSYLNFMVRRICEGENPVAAISPFRKLTRWEKTCSFLTSTLRQPYDFVKMLRTVCKESSAWNPPSGTLSKEYTVAWSKPIKMDAIKKIKSTYGVSFQSVLNAVIAGTIQSLMKRAGQKVPRTLNAFVPFPAAGTHPGGLCIHTDFSIVKVPIAGNNPVRRLERADKFWMESLDSTARRMAHKVVGTLGWLPWVVGEKFLHNDLPNIGMSCFPGIQGNLFLDKQKFLETNFVAGTQRDDSMAAVFTTLSCFGVLRFVMIIVKILSTRTTMLGYILMSTSRRNLKALWSRKNRTKPSLLHLVKPELTMLALNLYVFICNSMLIAFNEKRDFYWILN